jgi:hypothetical protein
MAKATGLPSPSTLPLMRDWQKVWRERKRQRRRKAVYFMAINFFQFQVNLKKTGV